MTDTLPMRITSHKKDLGKLGHLLTFDCFGGPSVESADYIREDRVQALIDALRFYADFDPDRERGHYGVHLENGDFILDEGSRAAETLEGFGVK